MPKVVRVEVCLSQTFKWPVPLQDEQLLRDAVAQYITTNRATIVPGQICRIFNNLPALFLEAVSSLVICDRPQTENEFRMYFYVPTMNGGEIEFIECERNSEEEIEAGTHWMLPCMEFEGLYENLVFETGIKENLLSLAETTVEFSRHKVDPNIVANNRLILAWGPPGTGKTSLCKALAQKLAIRSLEHFPYTHLIEINCHSLFSKWFSESGKLVQQMFQKIHELVENPKSLVCVLIDEVESIAYSRGSVGSNEPTDSLRVVNAVLTQLDRIRRYNNVLVLTTSNVPGCIDNAFIDRADVVQYIGAPNATAIESIYLQIIEELARCKVIVQDTNVIDDEIFELCGMSVGLSGRNIRKIPLLAHSTLEVKTSIPILEFLEAMNMAARKMVSEKKSFDVTKEESETVHTHYLDTPGSVEDVLEDDIGLPTVLHANGQAVDGEFVFVPNENDESPEASGQIMYIPNPKVNHKTNIVEPSHPVMLTLEEFSALTNGKQETIQEVPLPSDFYDTETLATKLEKINMLSEVQK